MTNKPQQDNARYILNRFEDNSWTVLERPDGELFNAPREWLPEEAREGDVLKVDAASKGRASRVSFTIDATETAKRREAARERREHLPKGPEGDIEL